MIPTSTFAKLQERLQQPLPGKKAQYRMAHVARHAERPVPDHARIAGVLALFYPDSRSDWRLALIERVSHNPRDRHGGQISFPGGRYEEGDGDLLQTALRETREEIGVDTGQVEVLGRLTELYIPVSNYLVHPFVGVLPFTPSFQPQWDEVAAMVEVPLRALLHPSTRRITELRIAPHIILKEVPCFVIDGKIIWGATAMMLSELLELMGEP